MQAELPSKESTNLGRDPGMMEIYSFVTKFITELKKKITKQL